MRKIKLSKKEKELILDKTQEYLESRIAIPEQFIVDPDVLVPPPKNFKKPVLVITASAYMKMLALTLKSKTEISWHCICKKAKSKERIYYLIDDIIVFPQKNTATSTDTDDKEYAKWITTAPVANMRGHGHSHVNMDVFSSGIDDKYQEDLLAKVKAKNTYYIFIIMNKKHEVCTLIYDYEEGYLYNDNDIYLEIRDETDNSDILAWAENNIKSYCTYPKASRTKATKDYSQLMLDNIEDDLPVFKGGYHGSK